MNHDDDDDEDLNEEEAALIKRAAELSLLMMGIPEEDVDEIEFEIYDNGGWSLIVTKHDGTVVSGNFSNHPKGTHPGSNSRH